MKSNPTQIIKWLRTRQQGSSLPNREKAANLIEELQGAVIASQSRIAELERQVAIGQRAVEMLRKHQHAADISLRASYCPECDKIQPQHADDCELSAILRNAEQAGMVME